MNNIETMKLALEAFEWNYNTDLDNIPACEQWAKMLKKNIAALRQAIEQAQEQEPVVWMYQNKSTHEVRFQKHMRSFVDHGAWYEVPLYSEPLANQEKTSGSPIKQVLAQQAEPVAWMYEFYADMGHKGLDFEKQRSAHNTPLYASPPPRQPLTDEEIAHATAPVFMGGNPSLTGIARAIESAHGIKEKNT